MNKIKQIKGFCPTQNKEYYVSLTCIDTGQGVYLKGTVSCDFTKYGGICNLPDCPIRGNYPEQFT